LLLEEKALRTWMISWYLWKTASFVVFVENSLPGDRVTAKITKVKKNYAEAFPAELLEPSPLRQEAPCDHFGYCGGCKWQNIDYALQLRFKRQHVQESLQHIGKISPEKIHDPIPAPEIFGYRNKMEFSFSENRWLTPAEIKNPDIKKGFALGFHVPRFFDRIIDINKCWLQTDLFNDILSFSKEYFKTSGIPIYNLHTKDGILRYLVLRQSFANRNVMVNVVTFREIAGRLKDYAQELSTRFSFVGGVINTINPRYAQVATGDKHVLVSGAPVIHEELGKFRFEVSPDSFFQTNSLQAETLYNIVREYARVENHRVWDLYSGTGSIAIFLAEQAREVVGFEIVENAVKDAYRNAELNGVSNCRFVAGDLRFNLRQQAAQPPDAIICDPPRSGMHKDVLSEILKIAPQRIVYVSCNPATMARDLAQFVDDYQVKEVQPVDMFPHTYHIESIAKLVKK
jgi:23S rRNA (uracil1939-C5)-methyltransferase